MSMAKLWRRRRYTLVEMRPDSMDRGTCSERVSSRSVVRSWSKALNLQAVIQRYFVSPDFSLMISSMTVCQVRWAAAGSPAFQQTRARWRLKAGATAASLRAATLRWASALLRVLRVSCFWVWRSST